MILNDKQIRRLAIDFNMIKPFVSSKVREVKLYSAIMGKRIYAGDGVGWIDTNEFNNEKKVSCMSYGASHFGYDIRLSPNEFKIFKHIPGTIINPKDFNPKNLEDAALHEDEWGQYFIIPGHSYGLGVAVEKLNMPENITAICLGKSSYARCGLIANITPAEAGWNGNLTLEFSNSCAADLRVYANEGICQLVFLEGEPCETSYGDGKYQNQGEAITLSRA
jgi:dCTP deaminase